MIRAGLFPGRQGERPVAGGGARFADGGARRSGPDSGGARYTTTDGFLFPYSRLPANVGPAVATAAGVVTFRSDNVSFTVPLGRIVPKPARDKLKVGVNGFWKGTTGFRASADVTAIGPPQRVAEYTVGYLQTVYQSTRTFYYNLPGGNLPAGGRLTQVDTVAGLPVRDGTQGQPPWVHPPGPRPPRAKPFGNQNQSTQTVSSQDSPWADGPWRQTDGQGRQQVLAGTGGTDRFRTWLAVRNGRTGHVIALNYADWTVDYGTRVTRFDAQAPENSTVGVGPESGARITRHGTGFGWKSPVLTDPTANHAQQTNPGTW